MPSSKGQKNIPAFHRILLMRYERYVVAYDVANTKRRNKVSKILKGCGERVNLSVFECELEKGKLPLLRDKISKIVKKKEDIVIYYPLCLDCLARIESDGKGIERQYDKSLLSI